jgi:hypothetical protein
MSTQVTTAQRVTYRENLQLALQQKTSKLLPTVTDIDVGGVMAEVSDLIGEVGANFITTRHGDTLYQDTPHARRWIAQPPAMTYADLVDQHDKLATGIDLTGAYVKAGAATINKGTDDAILGGIFGNAQTGEKGLTLTPFNAANVINVDVGGVASGLNVAKVRAARKMLGINFVDLDEEELYIVVNSIAEAQLLGEVEVTSSDFRSMGGRALETGSIGKLLGFNFVHLELSNPLFTNAPLTLTGGGSRKLPVYTKSGVIAAFWERLFSEVERLPTKNYSTQVYARRQVAATRTQEGMVGYIEINEAA